MELIARIKLRFHEIGDLNEGDAVNKSDKSVAIFRIVGRSLVKALEALDSEVSLSHRPLVALAIPSTTMTKKQEAVYEAVVSACHRRSSKVFACGGDSEKLYGQVAIGGGADQWFSSVPTMVEALGKSESRHTFKKLCNSSAPAVQASEQWQY